MVFSHKVLRRTGCTTCVSDFVALLDLSLAVARHRDLKHLIVRHIKTLALERMMRCNNLEPRMSCYSLCSRCLYHEDRLEMMQSSFCFNKAIPGDNCS